MCSRYTLLAATHTAGQTTPKRKAPSRGLIYKMTTIQNSTDLLSYIVTLSSSGQKNWFGFTQQRITGIHLCHEIAKHHADKMTPEEIVEYVIRLNNAIYQRLLKGEPQ